jgi:hypothetical protein
MSDYPEPRPALPLPIFNQRNWPQVEGGGGGEAGPQGPIGPQGPTPPSTIISATTTGNTGFIDLVFPTTWKLADVYLEVLGANNTGETCAIQVGDSTTFYNSNYFMIGGGAIAFFNITASISNFGTSRSWLTLLNQKPLNTVVAQSIQQMNSSGSIGGYVKITNSSNLDRIRLRSTGSSALFATPTTISVIYQ